MGYDIYTGLLKAFPMAARAERDIQFSYDNNHPKLDLLKSTYHIEAIAGDGDDLSKSKNLLNWASGHIYHKGDYAEQVERDVLELLDYAFDKGSTHGINCVGLAEILSKCLLSVGLKAKTVFIMPCSPYDGDNHCVTQVYITEMKKWVMFDPTINAYIKNEHGKYLSLLEIRDHLANQEPVFFNRDAKYNEEMWTDDSIRENTEYFAKNLFYFRASEVSTFELSSFNSFDASENRIITLAPQGYDTKHVRLSNIEYRLKKFGDDSNMRFFMQKWLEGVKREVCTYCSSDDFEKTDLF